MKKKVFCTVVLTGMLSVLAVFTSCGNKSTVDADAQATEEQFEPDERYASLDSVLTVLTYDLSDKTVDELVYHFENQSLAVKSYWFLNHKGGDESQIDKDVCSELAVLADSLSGGSTMDMMTSGIITSAVARYLTTKEYVSNYSKNPLYQAEMSDWLALEDELKNFYCDLAELANWGGSITKVTSTGALSYLSEARQEDYSQLKKDGQYGGSEGLTIAEARTNLIQELEDAKSLEDNPAAGEDFNKTLKRMRESGDKVVELLDKWLASRAKLCDSEGIPERHTAHLISQMGQRIMELIEG